METRDRLIKMIHSDNEEDIILGMHILFDKLISKELIIEDLKNFKVSSTSRSMVYAIYNSEFCIAVGAYHILHGSFNSMLYKAITSRVESDSNFVEFN